MNLNLYHAMHESETKRREAERFAVQQQLIQDARNAAGEPKPSLWQRLNIRLALPKARSAPRKSYLPKTALGEG
jgi:hypothetical protein